MVTANFRIAKLVAALFALTLGGAASGDILPIREARWLPVDRLYDGLSSEPGECLVWPSDPVEKQRVSIGRVAFGAPLLLGGQAARTGLSCASCHRNGRGNPDFLFRGLSGEPGTADVTSSLMSSKRGDRIANPKPIPDLGGPRNLLKVPHRPDGTLEAFIEGLVVEEFDGPKAGGEVIAALAAYVRALRPEACSGQRPIRLADRLDDVERAVAAAGKTSGDTRRLMLAAARSGLGAVDERFQAVNLHAERTWLKRLDAVLHAARTGTGDLAAWHALWPEARQVLLAAEDRSLFSKARLRRAIEASRPR